MSNPLYPDELVHCITTGEAPTASDLLSVAERIWRDGATSPPAFSWADEPSGSPAKTAAIRAALLALNGDEDRTANIIAEATGISPR